MRLPILCTVCATLLAGACALPAQSTLDPLSHPSTSTASPLTQPTLPAGTLFLFDLEKKFSAATLAGGGSVFASWFAEDGVEIQNKKAPLVGRTAIAAMAYWKANDYQLQWTPQGGAMMPTGDSGYTWGHYEARSVDAFGKTTLTTGRYISFWKKQPDGTWKVALDTSNEEPEDCGCTVPPPGTPSAPAAPQTHP
jgi:ketosteroid isomerase-like protein